MPGILTEFFERVYILSLPQRETSRGELAAHLEKLGLVTGKDLIWISAVPGELCPAPAYFRGGNGAWGCLQTHSRVVQDAAMQGIRSCLVLEDDVCFHPRSASWLHAWLPLVPADWEQLYLGGQHLQEPGELYEGSAVWRVRNVNRTHAYALHQRVYGRFLAHIHHAPDYLARLDAWHIDHQLGFAHERNLWRAYCPAWWVVGQAAGTSSVSGQSQPARWWQPQRYARHLPFVYVPEGGIGLAAAQAQALLGRVHFGRHRRTDLPLVDAGLDAVASGYRGLGEWLEMIAYEALEHGLLPGVCHPRITLEAVTRQWPQAGIFECGPQPGQWPDLGALADYPANGQWASSPFGGVGVG